MLLLPFVYIFVFTSLYFVYFNFKYKQDIFLIPVLFISISIKFYIFVLSASNTFQNTLTQRDESTFIKNSLNSVYDFQSPISAGDSFITAMGSFFLWLFENNIVYVQLLPVVSTIIVFHFIYRFLKFFNFGDLDNFIIMIFALLLPSYLFFHNSFTKEFLQLIFLLGSVYYSLKTIKKYNSAVFIKLLLFLFMFSLTHRGFELASITILFLVFSFKLFSFIFSSNIFKSFIFFVCFAISIIVIFTLLFSLPFVEKLFINNEFSDMMQEIRFYNSDDENNYFIPLNFTSVTGTILTMSNLLFHYLFHLKNLFILKNFYYLCEVILLITVLIFIFFNFFINYLNYFYTKDKKNINSYIFIFLVFIFINVGFAIFTSNFANALRHKTITNFMLFLYFPLIRAQCLSFLYFYYKQFQQGYKK